MLKKEFLLSTFYHFGRKFSCHLAILATFFIASPFGKKDVQESQWVGSLCAWFDDIQVPILNCLMKRCLTILISWIFLPISLLFFNHLSFKTLLDYYILTSMNILLKKASKASKRLFDPGSIVKSPLCIRHLCTVVLPFAWDVWGAWQTVFLKLLC